MAERGDDTDGGGGRTGGAVAVHADHLRQTEPQPPPPPHQQPSAGGKRRREDDEAAAATRSAIVEGVRSRERHEARLMRYDEAIEERRKERDYMWRLMDRTERAERSARLADLCRTLRAQYGRQRGGAAGGGGTRARGAIVSDRAMAAIELVASDRCDDPVAQDALWLFGVAMCPGLLDWLVGATVGGAPPPPVLDRAGLERFVHGTLVRACDALLRGADGTTVEQFVRAMRYEYVATVGLAAPSVEMRVAYECGERATAIERARAVK